MMPDPIKRPIWEVLHEAADRLERNYRSKKAPENQSATFAVIFFKERPDVFVSYAPDRAQPADFVRDFCMIVQHEVSSQAA